MATNQNKSQMPGGSKKKLRSARNKASGKYLRQAVRTEANRRRRRERHLKNHPQDQQLRKRLTLNT